MNLYLGFEFAPLQNWQAILPEPKAPANYKDPVKIQAYIDARIVELEQGKAATDTLSGRVSRAVVLGSDKKGNLITLWDIKSSHAGNETLAFIADHATVERMGNRTLTLFGYRIHRAARLMALDAMLDAKDFALAYLWALDLDPDFRYGRIPGYVDPVSALFGSSDVDLAAVSRRTEVPLPRETDAASMATLAYALAHGMGF